MKDELIRVSATFDNSGYGAAAKDTTMLLINDGFEICTNIIQTPMSRRDFAHSEEFKEIAKRISDKRTKINLAITVPFLCDYHFQKHSYCILNMFWETDRLCQQWVDMINNGLTDEIWVPCKSNYDALINSNIKKPIYIIPQYVASNIISKEKAEKILPIPGNDETYRFYSIFQWTQRKNPNSLLKAYYNEFSAKDNVMLVLKTYGPSPFTDQRWIKETILDIKEQSGNPNPPPVFYLGELLQPNQVNAIHSQCQCYISTSRGEGWNIPFVDALNHNKQVITTRTGGIVDWMQNDSVYIIPHSLIPVDTSVQAWGNFYVSTPPQQWGEIDVEHVQNTMRQAYNERNEFSSRSDKYMDILNICSKQNVLSLIKERLNKIY